MPQQSPVGPGMARIAGLCALLAVILQILSQFVLSGGQQPSPHTSAASLASLAAQNRIVPEIGSYLDVLAPVFFLVFAIILIRRAGPDGGAWSTVLIAGTAIWLATDIVFDGGMYALRELAHYGTSAGGVVTLFFLGQGVLWANAPVFALIFGSLGMLTVRAGILPAPLGWPAVLLGLSAFLVPPLTMSPLGALGLVIWALLQIWLLIVGVMLLVRASAWAEQRTVSPASPRVALSKA